MKSKTRKKLRELQRRIEAVESRLPAQDAEGQDVPAETPKAVRAVKDAPQA